MRLPDRQEPTEHETGRHGTEIRHPAFGAITVTRCSSNPAEHLHGSDFAHGHFMHVVIHRAHLRRDLARDWHSPGQEIVRIAMTETQWASFVASNGAGEGTPCTLEHVEGTWIPGIKRTMNKRDRFRAEAAERLQVVKDALAELKTLIDGAALSGKAKKAMADQVHQATMNLDANLGFVADQFSRHIERTTEQAKTEVQAYIQQALRRAGIDAVQAGTVNLLGDGGTEDDGGGDASQG